MPWSDGKNEAQIIERAKGLLLSAGADPEFVEAFTSNPAAAAKVADNPGSAAMIAFQNPSQTQTLYGEMAATFPSGIGAPTDASLANLSRIPAKDGYEINPTNGLVRYNNGVFYDPDADQVVFNHADPEQQGSLAWFARLQESGSEKQIETWRTRLQRYGYDVGDKGGFDAPLKAALADFFQSKYKNLGKPLAVGDQFEKAQWGGTLDPAVLHNEVRGWYETAFGDDPTDAELDWWSDKLKRSAQRIARNQGLDPGAAVTVAQARTQEKFRESPDVQEQADWVKETGANMQMRDRLEQAAQVFGSL
jgi:hypothetical protein